MGNDINCAYFYSWTHLIIMKVLRWRLRAFEGEVIGKEFNRNDKDKYYGTAFGGQKFR